MLARGEHDARDRVPRGIKLQVGVVAVTSTFEHRAASRPHNVTWFHTDSLLVNFAMESLFY